ncbi:unnamed protein product [Symbiodinium natans]|uniref:Uncharacterized protein n=1 Tax=Symbiodinium natans TaxID=878477 RepID=A0A812JVL8_9DINO|nr:unnamed protein product [Symbiodinium natans]
MSSTPTPSEASGSQTGLVPALLCQKCGEATNMASSSATGRNPLLRACNGCCATEKWLNRSLAKPKGRDETEEEKARRLNAQKIKDELKATRRPKTGRIGHVEERRIASSFKDNVEVYVPFRTWAAQEMSLKVYNTLKEAEGGWEKLLANPATLTVQQNGQTCVKQFHGVEVRQRDGHEFQSGLRQRMDISDEKELDEYLEENESRLKRAKNRLSVEAKANEEEGGEKIIPLLTVRKDLGQLKEIEEARDAEMHAQAAAIAERKAREAKQKKDKEENQEKSLPLEKLALQSAKGKAVQTMTNVLLRLQTVYKTLEEEANKITENESEDIKKEQAAKFRCVAIAMQTLETAINEKDKSWEHETSTHQTADQLAALRQQITEATKNFHTTSEECKAARDTVTDVRCWLNSTKKAIRDAEKAAQKTAAGKKIAKVAASNTLEQLGMALAKDCSGMTESCGNMSYSLNAVFKLDYYKLQKTWVAEKMKFVQGSSCSAIVSKKAVAGRLAQFLQRSWPDILGDDPLRGIPAEAQDHFVIQFAQRHSNTGSIYARTEMNCPMLLILLEGELAVGGFRPERLGGKTLAEEVKKLESMTATQIRLEAENHGWISRLKPGASIVIPSNCVWFELSGDDDENHSIRQVLGREAFTPAMLQWLQQMDKEGSLAQNEALVKSGSVKPSIQLEGKIQGSQP